MQSVITRYHGHTNTLPARISATSTAGKRYYFPAGRFETDQENHRAAAAAFVKCLGWRGTYVSGAYNDKGALIWVCLDEAPNTSFTAFRPLPVPHV